jgi:hypothetical protein
VNLHSARLAEEGHDEEPEREEDGSTGDEQANLRLVALEIVNHTPQGQADETRGGDYFITLFIDLHIVIVLG